MRVLILGGKGYVGSRLHSDLTSKGYDVTSYDLCWFGDYTSTHSIHKDFNEMTKNDLASYDAIVLLAAHSSVKMCVGNYMSSFNNNVKNFMELVYKLQSLSHSIKLIYASSSSVYGNTGSRIATEEQKEFVCVNNYDLSKYTIDQYMLNNNPIPEWYGLRFGTINGFSKNFRSELMINSMTKNAIETGQIYMSNPKIHRAILSVSDLCGAIDVLLKRGTKETSGVYNINSFNNTVENFANEVASITKAKIIDQGNVGRPYDFMISNEKFSDTFQFKFTSTAKSIVNEIKQNYGNLNATNRDTPIIYE